MTKMRLLSHGTNKTVRMTAAPNGEGEENDGEDDAGSEDEEEMDGDDGDAAAAKQRSRKNEEQEYDNDEGNVNFEEEETNEEGKAYSPYTILWKQPFLISPCSKTPSYKYDQFKSDDWKY